jgi:hypothetical protein
MKLLKGLKEQVKWVNRSWCEPNSPSRVIQSYCKLVVIVFWHIRKLFFKPVIYDSHKHKILWSRILEPDINLLELPTGLKDILINAGFSTIKSILECTLSDISSKIGVNL